MGSHYNLETHWNTISDTSIGKKKRTKKGVNAGNYILFKLNNEFSITLNIETSCG